MRTVMLTFGVAIALLAAAPLRAQTAADPSPRGAKPVNGDALEDVDKKLPFSKREINRRQHRQPEEYRLPPPNLRPPPPLTIDVAPVPLPDPRPRPLFSKDFPSLKFEREDEYGFKFNERGG